MIEINNLTKIYNSVKSQEVVALDKINLKLSDHGMVFITGESGSGKSTLLNCISCFDDITEGEIIVDGTKIHNLKASMHDQYRNHLIGFIFQDYNLISNLTIKENVELALTLQNKKDDNKISEILEKVGLKGFEERYPKELSGGQKQRVAIARCLIKNPKYILADEPTGNLDKRTSEQILDLLKEISKEHLVLIVSHNRNSTLKYGDRVIELEDGKIISDTFLTDSKLIDNNLNESKIDFDTKNKLSIKNFIKLSKPFTKGNIGPLIFSSLLTSFLLIVLLLSQLFFYFDGNKFIEKESIKDVDFAIYREIKNKRIVSPIYENDINKFYELGYTGNIYKLYNYNLPIDLSNYLMDDKTSLPRQLQVEYDLFKSPFITTGKGVLECDLDYLTTIYGVDGELDLLAGSLEDTGECEIIITDYFADCLKYYRDFSKYQIVDLNYIEMELSRYKVKAIINTNYQERYRDLILDYLDILEIDDVHVRKEKYDELTQNKMFIEFYNEMNTYLSVGYFIDGDFRTRVCEDLDHVFGTWSINPKIYDLNGELNFFEEGTIGYCLDDNLSPGEIVFGVKAYEYFFGPDEDPILPKEIILTEKYISSESREKDLNLPLNITGFREDYPNNVYLSRSDFIKVWDKLLINYGLYFDNEEQAKSIYYEYQQLEYFTNDIYLNALHSVNKIINIFQFVFIIFTYLILLAISISLISFALRNVKRKILEIGILRALGAKNIDIFIIILSQVIVMLLFVVILSILPILTLDTYVNHLLLEGIMYFTKSYILSEVTIISFQPQFVLFDFILILFLVLICSLLLFIRIRKIKPINIIKKSHN